MMAFICDECGKTVKLRRDEAPAISFNFVNSVYAEFDTWECAAVWVMKNCSQDRARTAVKRVFPSAKNLTKG